MSFSITEWIDDFSSKVKETFGSRVLFIGLQGSYRRGEAHADSDIDVVVILDTLSVKDLKEHRKIIESMPSSEKCCGFISSKDVLKNWPKSELFQFYHDTSATYGSLEKLIPEIKKEDIVLGVKNGAAALYHQACHGFLFSDDKFANLTALYKNTFFILQSVYYLEKKKYISSRLELINLLEDDDKEILCLCNNKGSLSNDIDASYQKLIAWCDKLITKHW